MEIRGGNPMEIRGTSLHWALVDRVPQSHQTEESKALHGGQSESGCIVDT